MVINGIRYQYLNSVCLVLIINLKEIRYRIETSKSVVNIENPAV